MKKLILVLLLASSCFKSKVYDLKTCDKLSMEYFRGLPLPSKEFKKNCSKIKVNYTQEVCRDALKNMMMGLSEKDLKLKHGDKVMGCFNQNDTKKFLKD